MNVTPFSSYQQAFNEMQRYTELNEPFKLKFIKLNGDVKIIPKALLRKQTPSSKDSMSAYKMNYIDVVLDNMGNCYIPLIVEINDRQIIIQ